MRLLASFVLNNFSNAARTALTAYGHVHAQLATVLALVAIAFSRHHAEDDIYNVLWAVVFGFATLNILSLAARHFEPGRRGLNFGELLAVLVVLISIFLLGWEMLTLFHIFPIKLKG